MFVDSLLLFVGSSFDARNTGRTWITNGEAQVLVFTCCGWFSRPVCVLEIGVAVVRRRFGERLACVRQLDKENAGALAPHSRGHFGGSFGGDYGDCPSRSVPEL